MRELHGGNGRSPNGTRLLRELSDQSVLETILREGPSTRPTIARATGLSKPTVSQAVRRLLDMGLITEAGERRGGPGRVPLVYGIHPSAGYVVGVDVGGSNVRVAVSDIYGTLLHQHREPTQLGPRRLPRQLLRLVGQVLSEVDADPAALFGIGMSTPGVVDPGSHTLRLAYNLGVEREFDLAGPLRHTFDVPVKVENNVNLAAVGERWRGLAQNEPTFAFVAIGAGIGLGLVYRDELLRGDHGAAGEIAYLPLAEDPLHPSHHRRGSLEDEATGAALLEAARDHPGWTGDEPRTVAEIFGLAEEGHAAASDVVAAEGRRVALAVTSVCAVIDPALVVLGGGIGASPLLREVVRPLVDELVPFPPRIETSELGDSASLLGALAVTLRSARESLAPQHRR